MHHTPRLLEMPCGTTALFSLVRFRVHIHGMWWQTVTGPWVVGRHILLVLPERRLLRVFHFVPVFLWGGPNVQAGECKGVGLWRRLEFRPQREPLWCAFAKRTKRLLDSHKSTRHAFVFPPTTLCCYELESG